MPAAYPPGVRPRPREVESKKHQPGWLNLLQTLLDVTEVITDIVVSLVLGATGNPELIPLASVGLGVAFATARTVLSVELADHVNGFTIFIDYAASFLPMVSAGVNAAKSSKRLLKNFGKIAGLTTKQLKHLESQVAKKMAENLDNVTKALQDNIVEFNKLVGKQVGNNAVISTRRRVLTAKDFSMRGFRTNRLAKAKALRKKIVDLSKQNRALAHSYKEFKFTNKFKELSDKLEYFISTGTVPSYVKKTWKNKTWLKQLEKLDTDFALNGIDNMAERAAQRFTLSRKHIKALDASLDRVLKMEKLLSKPKNMEVDKMVKAIVSGTSHLAEKVAKHKPLRRMLGKIARKAAIGVLDLSETRSIKNTIKKQTRLAWQSLTPGERAMFKGPSDFEMAAYNYSNRKIYEVTRSKFVRMTGSRRFNDAVVQKVQAMFDANDLGRWPVEKMYQVMKKGIAKAFRGKRDKLTAELVKLEEKVILGTATEKDILEMEANYVNALMKKRDQRKLRRLKERWQRQMKKVATKGAVKTSGWKKVMSAEQRKLWRDGKGTLIPINRYLIGYKVLPMQKRGGKKVIMLHFDKANTMSDNPTSKNYGGKKDVIVTASKKDLRGLDTEGVAYYWAHGKRNFWYTSRGGNASRRHGLEVPHEIAFFLGFLPIQTLRNVLSITSNVVENVSDIAAGTWTKTWTKKFTSSFEKTGITRSIRLFMRAGVGGMIGKRFGDKIGANIGREMQKYSTTAANLVIGKDTKNGGLKFHGIGNQDVGSKFIKAGMLSARTQSLKYSRVPIPKHLRGPGEDMVNKRAAWVKTNKGKRGLINKKIADQRKFGYARRIPGAVSPNRVLSPTKFGRIW